MSEEREMTLAEWCGRLPKSHLANRELAALERELAEARAALDEYRDLHMRVLSDECRPDEYHCGCVPPLRARLSRLEAVVRDAIETVKSYGKPSIAGLSEFYTPQIGVRQVERWAAALGENGEVG